jgi:hypothetical protein
LSSQAGNIESTSGYLQGAGRKAEGSHVTLKVPNNSDYRIIIETLDAIWDRPFTFEVTNGLSTGAAHV